MTKSIIHTKIEENTCNHIYVERVVITVNDHYINEDKWICINCGKLIVTKKPIDSLESPVYVPAL